MSAVGTLGRTTEVGDERAILKATTMMLLLAMVVRHAEFYLFPEGLLQEMGAVQPWIGVWLIPVTTAFGFLMFWGRGFRLTVSNYDLVRFVVIGAIPLVIALASGQITQLMTYSYLDASRRPPFLILLPICLAIMSTRLTRPIQAALAALCGALMLFAHNFIANYLFLFLLFGFSQSWSWYQRFLRSVWSVLLYCCMVAGVFFLQIERVGWVMEFLMASAFIGLIFQLATVLKPLVRQITQWPVVAGCGVLYFYLAQSLLFTAFKYLKWTTPVVLIICVVFSASLWIGWKGKLLDRKVEAWLFRG